MQHFRKIILRVPALKELPMGQVIPFRKRPPDTKDVEAAVARLIELLAKVPLTLSGERKKCELPGPKHVGTTSDLVT
jgi:hypothetical protein